LPLAPPFPALWGLSETGTLAAAATATLPLLPLTVRFALPLMLGLQPAFTVAGIARLAKTIAIVMSEIHLFIRWVLWVVDG